MMIDSPISTANATALLMRDAMRTPARLIASWDASTTITTTSVDVAVISRPSLFKSTGARPKLSPVKPGMNAIRPAQPTNHP